MIPCMKNLINQLVLEGCIIVASLLLICIVISVGIIVVCTFPFPV